jgi:hypothetical protein
MQKWKQSNENFDFQETTSESLVAPEWFYLLVVGAVGGVAIGWLLVALEKLMQKWKQSNENFDFQETTSESLDFCKILSDLTSINDTTIQVTEAITIEFQGLVEFTNNIKYSEDEKPFEYYRLQILQEIIDLSYKFICDVEIHTDRLKKEWYDLSLQERKKLRIRAHIQLEKLIEEQKKENDIFFTTPVIRFREINEILRAIVSFKFSLKNYLQKLHELNAERKELTLYRRRVWAKLLFTIINLSWLDEVSVCYKLINPVEISDFIGSNRTLKNILLDTVQIVQNYFESKQINKLTLELVKDPEFEQLDRLVICIYTEMNIEAALDKLTDFKLDVWIDYVGDLLSKVSVDIVHEISMD